MSERFGTGCSVSPVTTASGLESSLLLGMNGFRPESHVAQQSRRDKLRVQQPQVSPAAAPAPSHHHLLNLPSKPDPHHPDLFQVRDVRICDGSLYDQAMFSAGAGMETAAMLDFSSVAAAHVSSDNGASFSSPQQNPRFDSGSRFPRSCSPQQNPGLWRAVGGSQPITCDLFTNYVSAATGGGGGISAPIHNPFFAAQNFYPKPGGFSGYQDVQSPMNNTSNELQSQEDCRRHYVEFPFSSTPFSQNVLQEVVTSSNVGSQHGLELAATPLVQPDIREAGQPSSWPDGGNELALLPSYANQSNAAGWVSRQSLQWNGEEGGFGAIRVENATKSLSLSLSSIPPPEMHVVEFEGRFGVEHLPSPAGIAQTREDPMGGAVGQVSSPSKLSLQGVVSSSVDARRCLGPLGPFTGYATILKNSKFLKPAQMLLEEFCSVVTAPKPVKRCEVSERTAMGASMTCNTAGSENDVVGLRVAGNSCGSSVSMCSSSEASGEGGVGCGSVQIHRPEFQQKKAKLLYMQEEVCRRYKQYHQQMQMVVSSFQTVAGLNSATPYTSLALKAVSKHFRCLKNVISEQLRHISKVLGEEFMMSSPGSSLGDTVMTPRLKFIDQTFRKQKAGEGELRFLDNSPPVWRPQRGLPERAVAVLRAWLFEHFLHPYPTDTDKHMLASQTGLSRNQVSNWFINARVRLWKPMVEEIHMLETKGLAEMDLNSSKNEGKPSAAAATPSPPGGGGPTSDSHRSNRPSVRSLSECSYSGGPVSNGEDQHQMMEQWHREKRTRMEHCSTVPTGMNGGLISFSPYQGGGGIDLSAGIGSVSLTLGLRHNEGAAHHHQQQQQQQMRHFGTRIHDFVG